VRLDNDVESGVRTIAAEAETGKKQNTDESSKEDDRSPGGGVEGGSTRHINVCVKGGKKGKI